MTSQRKTFIVVNPNSANGSTARAWPLMEERIRRRIGAFDSAFTEYPRQATELTREAVAKGYEQIVSVGGDGTNNEVVNGFFDGERQINPDCAFCNISRGTGGDFRKTFGWDLTLESAIERIAGEHIRPIDVGRFSYRDHDGKDTGSYFANITSFGMSGLVDHICNTSSKALGGKMSFLLATLRALLRYKNQRVRLKIDDHFDEELTINVVSVANGRFYGGGMMIAPQAEIDDGLFDVVIMGDLNKREIIASSSHIYKGTHLQLPKFRVIRGKRIVAESDQDVYIDMDGEQPGMLPCVFENHHRVLPLKVLPENMEDTSET